MPEPEPAGGPAAVARSRLRRVPARGGRGSATACACFRGAISVWICSRVSGPRRYDSAQRVWKTTGWSSCTLFIRKTRLPRPERIWSIFWPVEALPGRVRGPFQPLEHAVLVALGLQPAQEPGAGVGQPLVVEVDRVLRRQHDPQAEGPRLLEQGQHRHLRRRVGRGGEVAEDLVHVEHGPQARRARLGPHPGQHLVQQDRDEEHPLVVREVRDRDDREPRLALAGVEQAADVERLALHPGGEPGRGEQVVQLHRQGEPLLGRDRTSPGRSRRPCRTAATAPRGSSPPGRGRGPPARRGRGRSRAGCARGWRSDRRRSPGAPAAPRPPRPTRSRYASRLADQGRRRRGERPEDRQRQPGARCPACRSPGRRRRGTARSAPRPGPSRPAPPARSRPSARRTARARAPCGPPRRDRPRAGSPRRAARGRSSSRLPRSPLGSIAITGMPSIAASSSSDRHSPVLPLPVIPTQTACVVSCFES